MLVAPGPLPQHGLIPLLKPTATYPILDNRNPHFSPPPPSSPPFPGLFKRLTCWWTKRRVRKKARGERNGGLHPRPAVTLSSRALPNPSPSGVFLGLLPLPFGVDVGDTVMPEGLERDLVAPALP